MADDAGSSVEYTLTLNMPKTAFHTGNAYQKSELFIDDDKFVVKFGETRKFKVTKGDHKVLFVQINSNDELFPREEVITVNWDTTYDIVKDEKRFNFVKIK